jgi:hypothetical protein
MRASIALVAAGRGSHALQTPRRQRAGPAGTDRRPVKDNRTKLYIIQEPRRRE